MLFKLILLCVLCFSEEQSFPSSLFSPEEQRVLNKHTDLIVNNILTCPVHDQENHLECARLKFAQSFPLFEAEWTAVENATSAPAPCEEIEQEMSECLIACILRGAANNTERCVRRCGRIMEGVAEVSKRKALLATAVSELKAAEDKVAASKVAHTHTESSAQDQSLLHPLLAKQEEEKERAAAVARAAFKTVKNTRKDRSHRHKSEL